MEKEAAKSLVNPFFFMPCLSLLREGVRHSHDPTSWVNHRIIFMVALKMEGFTFLCFSISVML